MKAVYRKTDVLEELNGRHSLDDKISLIHKLIITQHPLIKRISVTLLDEKSQVFKTFLASSPGENPLPLYECPVDDAPSLRKIIETSQARIVNDLSIFDAGTHQHTKKIATQRYRSSYTVPAVHDNHTWGLIFFNATRKNYFTTQKVHQLDVFAHLMKATVLNELISIRTMIAALRTANQMVHFKDPETGSHLERMARFSRIIARELARSGKYDFNDDYIEHIFNFAPMHDVGKIAIPDRILLKPARLNDAEYDIMKTHTTQGRQLIDLIISNFDFDSFEHIELLRHIAEYHHETMDGHGYPLGLEKRAIPIEAKIIAAADIFDALTSERPYKQAWTNNQAFAYLQDLEKSKLDADCVEALIKNRNEISDIQATFADTKTDLSRPVAYT